MIAINNRCDDFQIFDANIEAFEGIENIRDSFTVGRVIWDMPDIQLSSSLNRLEVSFDSRKALDLNYITEAENIDSLTLENCKIDNFERISSFSGLRELSLYEVAIEDLSPIEGLSKLERIQLNNVTGIEDYSSLERIKTLKYVYANHTKLDEAKAESLRDLGIEVYVY